MKKKRMLQAAGLLLGLAALGIWVYWLRPPCWILQYTGYYCAGCGTQRMVSALLAGDLPGALRQNPFMLGALPLAGAFLLWEARHYVQGKPPVYKKRWFLPVLLGAGALAVVFTVLRNLPGFGFLGPL